MEIRDKNRINIKKCTVTQRNRTHSYKYCFRIRIGEKKLIVCQNCFRFTLGKNESFLKIIGKKKVTEKLLIADQRGKREPINKLTEDKLEEIKSHINLFPSYLFIYFIYMYIRPGNLLFCTLPSI